MRPINGHSFLLTPFFSLAHSSHHAQRVSGGAQLRPFLGLQPVVGHLVSCAQRVSEGAQLRPFIGLQPVVRSPHSSLLSPHSSLLPPRAVLFCVFCGFLLYAVLRRRRFFEYFEYFVVNLPTCSPIRVNSCDSWLIFPHALVVSQFQRTVFRISLKFT
mgnify:CR=1 FL=1